jgi:hypothetical protein
MSEGKEVKGRVAYNPNPVKDGGGVVTTEAAGVVSSPPFELSQTRRPWRCNSLRSGQRGVL